MGRRRRAELQLFITYITIMRIHILLKKLTREEFVLLIDSLTARIENKPEALDPIIPLRHKLRYLLLKNDEFKYYQNKWDKFMAQSKKQ